MKQCLILLIGKCIDIFVRIFYSYKRIKLYNALFQVGENSNISYPFHIEGCKNIVIENDVHIGQNATITAINAKVIIKRFSVCAPYLYISTGDHKMIPGRFFKTIGNEEKGVGYDADVIINEDVWIGSRVTILKGVEIGRGSIVAAGSVVTKDVLPYSVYGGIPARFIKFKWDLDTIIKHENKLYLEKDRISVDTLTNNFMSIKNLE